MNTLGIRRTVKTVTLRVESLQAGDVIDVGGKWKEVETVRVCLDKAYKRAYDKDLKWVYVTFTNVAGQKAYKAFEAVKVQVLV